MLAWRDFPLKLIESTHKKTGLLIAFKQSFAANGGKFQNIHYTVAGIPYNARSLTKAYNSTFKESKQQN